MDRKLIFYKNRLAELTTEFNRLTNEINKMTFEVGTEIPESLQRSYYNNETLFNPVQKTFEQCQTNLKKRPNPLYSVAIIDNQIVSSVYGERLAYERLMNLWVTNSGYRQSGVGKIVLLNLIKHSFENDPNLPIKAWDVTSQHVDDFLKTLGFE